MPCNATVQRSNTVSPVPKPVCALTHALHGVISGARQAHRLRGSNLTTLRGTAQTDNHLQVYSIRCSASTSAKAGSNVALFSHGQLDAALAARWIDLPLITGQHFELWPASLSILGHEAHHPRRRVLQLWNEVAASESPLTATTVPE